MADVFDAETRSRIMALVRGKDTKPERAVRSMVHRMGYRFRLHGRDLPGRPDLVLPRHRKVIFVHGCFWHSHKGCKRATVPEGNRAFWEEKLGKNAARDRRNVRDLKRLGWGVLVVWECQLRRPERVWRRLEGFLREHD